MEPYDKYFKIEGEVRIVLNQNDGITDMTAATNLANKILSYAKFYSYEIVEVKKGRTYDNFKEYVITAKVVKEICLRV